MYNLITIPIFLINIVAVVYAMMELCSHYKHSVFKPRLIMIAMMILANIPYSMLVILPCLINNGFLERYKSLCYAFTAFLYLLCFKILALTNLTIFVLIVFFTKYTPNRINFIGNLLNWGAVAIMLLVELVLLPLTGAKLLEKYELNGKNHFRECGTNSIIVRDGSYYWQIGVSFITVLVSCLLLVHSYSNKKIKRGTSSRRIIVTFILFSIANMLGMMKFFLKTILRIKLKPITAHIIDDSVKITPAVFALIYIFSECNIKKENKNFDIEKILKTKRTRKLFKEYLSENRIKEAYDLVNKWEGLQNIENKKDRLLNNEDAQSEKEELKKIVKTLELQLFGFLMSEMFNDYYEISVKSGKVEANLTNGVERINNN